MALYTLILRRLWKRKILGNVTEETEERDKSSEQEKRRVIIALISFAVVFAAHVMHSMTYFRSMDVYPKILMEVEWLFYCMDSAMLTAVCIRVCTCYLARVIADGILQILQRLEFFCT